MEEKEVEKWIPSEAEAVADIAGSQPQEDAKTYYEDSKEGQAESHDLDSRDASKTQESTEDSLTKNKNNGFDEHDDALDVGDLSGLNLSYLQSPPKSPALASSDSMILTPYSSRDNDDLVIYSDSEVGSQNSLELRAKSPSFDTTPSALSKKSKSKKASPRRDSEESPSPKPRRRLRRKSNKSDSEKSYKSSIRHELPGSGYTATPATGKVFRNLLILEESLREQVIQQRALRRKYLTFLSILCSFIVSISHHLYFSDTHGTLRVILQFVLFALIITLLLYHLSGEYQKTIVLPRRFLSSTNKGIRQLNVRLVKIKVPVTDSIADLIRELALFIITTCLQVLHKFDPSSDKNKNSKLEVFLVSCQAQCQPKVGLTDVKLVLNARVFNTDVREGWELYRSEFWIHEGVRRRNALTSFVTGNDENILDREKLLKKDRLERKERKRSNTNTQASKLSEQNLAQLVDSEPENMPQDS